MGGRANSLSVPPFPNMQFRAPGDLGCTFQENRAPGWAGSCAVAGQRAGCRREAFALYRGILQLFPLTGQTHFPDISGKTSASEVSPVGEDASESPHLNTESI